MNRFAPARRRSPVLPWGVLATVTAVSIAEQQSPIKYDFTEQPTVYSQPAQASAFGTLGSSTTALDGVVDDVSSWGL